MADRVEHIDIAKGISIIFVALSPSKLNTFTPELMNSMGLFRLPFFSMFYVPS